MKSVSVFKAFIWGIMAFLALQQSGYSMTTLSMQFEDTLRVISLNMPHKEVIETLGTPDIIKSQGKCLQYEFFGLSIFLNENDRVEQIYLSKSYEGSVGSKHPSRGIDLSGIEAEFGSAASVEKLNYQPSPIIQTRATTETENKTDPIGEPVGEFPLQYPGNKKLYTFYNAGKIMKYKYVLDDEGIAFWLDHNQQLYATVLYMSKADRPQSGSSPAGGEKRRLEMVHFDFDKHNIKKLYVPVLEEHVAYLTGNPTWPVTVEGHTDSRGSDAYNQKLSERRANAVRDYLIVKGIASSRIQVVGYSENRPIADNKTSEGRAMNRRAELEVTLEK